MNARNTCIFYLEYNYIHIEKATYFSSSGQEKMRCIFPYSVGWVQVQILNIIHKPSRSGLRGGEKEDNLWTSEKSEIYKHQWV